MFDACPISSSLFSVFLYNRKWIRRAESFEYLDLEKQVKILNKPFVKIYKQPAFDHPLLKNHKILVKNPPPQILLEEF